MLLPAAAAATVGASFVGSIRSTTVADPADPGETEATTAFPRISPGIIAAVDELVVFADPVPDGEAGVDGDPEVARSIGLCPVKIISTESPGTTPVAGMWPAGSAAPTMACPDCRF